MSERRTPSRRLSSASMPPCSSSGCADVCIALAVVVSLRSFCHAPLAPVSCAGAVERSGAVLTMTAASATRRIRFITAAPSKIELDGKLHLAWIAERAGDSAERAGVRHAPAWEPPVRPVEQVEGLDAELQPPRADRHVAEHREVHRFGTRSANAVRPTAAVRQQGGDLERRRVEPRINRLVETRGHGIANAVRAGDAAGAGVLTIVGGDGERPAVADVEDAVDDPIVEDGAGDALQVVVPSAAGRQLVDEAGDEPARDVERHWSVVFIHRVGRSREIARRAAAGAEVIEEIALRLAPRICGG